MAFLNLRNNHLIYVLKKDIIPTLEIGKVTHVTVPVPKYGNNIYSEFILDVSAEVGGNIENFLKLPANQEIADFGNNVVITTNKDAMNNEILSMKQKSLDIINSIDLHNKIVLGCDEILSKLNPERAELQKRELENKELRNEINQLKEMFLEFLNKNK